MNRSPHLAPPIPSHYDRMWTEAEPRIRRGGIICDEVLASRVADSRRALSLIIRPSLAVQSAVLQFLNELRALEPDQYYYAASELHITVLALFTATVDHEPFFARQAEYLAAVTAAVKTAQPFAVRFAGITASPGAVIIQGFQDDGHLNALRDRLRSELQPRGLATAIDTRYRLETAHLTAIRFRAPLRHPSAFAAALDHARKRAFGGMAVHRLQVVRNDWYMSASSVEEVMALRVGPPP